MTLVHVFVMSRIDYCSVVFPEAPKAITDKLQQLLNTAAHVVTGTRKFDPGLKQLIHSELHWLDAPERIMYAYASLSGWNCCTVSRGTLHASLCDFLKTSSSFCCQSSVCCAVFPLEFIRTSGFLCRRHQPDDMELTTKISARSYSHHICFWTIT